MRTTTNCACVICPPQENWQVIEALYSPKFGRWMPHINLLWPFVTQNHFEEVIKLLQADKSFQALRPFNVRLEKFAFNDNSKYLFIVPDVIHPEPAGAPKKKEKKKDKKDIPANPFVSLRNILLNILPDTKAENNKPNYDPHLSIGQFDQQKISLSEVKQNIESTWEPFEFEANEVLFITREGPNDTWKIHTRVKFMV